MSIWNQHNKTNKAVEHFVKLTKEWNAYQSAIFGGRLDQYFVLWFSLFGLGLLSFSL
jgi:menaquinone-dependent protoporphyrinogen IX oxidase